jgi:hypothetical protein
MINLPYLLRFNLLDRSGHWRPTTFSAGGYRAFCARDHRDGLGRTMPLAGERIGLQELVVADDGPITLEECEPLGPVGTDTAALVDEKRIISELMKRI